MPYQVEETGSLTRTASVQVPVDEYERGVDKALRKIAGRVKVRGFRKGKIPLPVLRQQYGPSVQNDVIQDLVDRYVNEIVNGAKNVLFIDQPKVTDFQQGNVALAFEVSFELRPNIDPIGYLGLAVEKPRIEVEEDAIDEEIEKLRTQFSSLEPIEDRTTIQKDDVVTFNFKAVDETDEDLTNFNGEGAQITIGQANALPGMEQALTGAAFDATVIATIEPGEGYQVETLRGKKFDVELTVTSVKQRVLPELDDDFAADTGQAETLAELRDQIRSQLAHKLEHSAGHFAENSMMERLVDKNDFELPPLFVRQQIDNKLREQFRQFTEQIPDFNVNMLGDSLDGLRDQLRPETEEQLRAEFLLLAIAEKEKITVGDEDMQKFFEHQAMHMNATPQQVARFYQQDRNRWQQAQGSALLEKTVNFLLDQAEIEEIDWPTEDELAARDAARQEKLAAKAGVQLEQPSTEVAEAAVEAAAETPAAPAAGDARETFEAMTVNDLKDLLRNHDLAVGGKKSELVDRLVEAGVTA